MGKSRKNGPKTRNEDSRKELLKKKNLTNDSELQFDGQNNH